MWEEGTFVIDDVVFLYSAKVFPLGSEFGINGGRISKLQIYKFDIIIFEEISSDADVIKNGNIRDNCIVNYDRGWDIRPRPCDKLDSEALDYVLSLYPTE